MKKLLVLALVLCCSCSYSFDTWSQMLDEATTVTTETTSEIQGDIEKVTTTTTTVVIENENTGAILSSESTGIVAKKYEGSMDADWGGAGSINSHNSCGDKLGVYTGSNTCASARTNSLTTWNQTVNLDQFSIDDGGQVRWEMRFGMEPSMYNAESGTSFVELKGYDDGSLKWTDTYNVDKSTFNLNANGNYIAPYGHINSNVDYAGGLDSLYINIGGYGEFMFDSVWFDIYHNQITTTIAESIVYNLIEQEIMNTANTLIDTNYNYSSDSSGDNNEISDMSDLGNNDYGASTDNSDNMSNDNFDNTPVATQTITVFSEIETSSPTTPETMTSSDTGANVDQMFSNITMDIDPEEVSNIQVMVADLNSVDTDVTQGTTTQDTDIDIMPIEMSTDTNDSTETTIMVSPEPTPEPTNEIESPPTEDAPLESEVTNEEPNNDNMSTTTTEKTATKEIEVENESTSEVDSAENQSENETKNVEVKATEETKEIEETKEVAENNTEPEEVKEDAQEESKPEEKATATNESEEKEEVKEEVKEEPKEEKVAEKKQKEEPKESKKEQKEEKEEKEIVKNDVKEEPKEEKTAEEKKQEKKQEAKENKAKKIMANFENTYDALAQITQLALVNALGPNISNYNNQQIEQPLTWYESKDIYSNNDIPDPLGNYFGVRDSLVFEKMVGEQYAK